MAKLKHGLTEDILFKMFFVKNQDLLKNLVSLVLGIPADSIIDFEITNGDITPESIGKKFCHLDINMKVNTQPVNLEVQVKDEGDYPERSLYYWARNYSSALPKSEVYADLPRTVAINIVAFNLFKEFAGFHSEFRPLEVTRHTELADKMSLHYFELEKLPEITEADAGDGLKIWLALFNAKTEEEMSKIIKIGGAIMGQAVAAYKNVVESENFEEAVRIRELSRYNEASALAYAERKGITQGKAEGKAEGIEEVFALLEQGLSVNEAKNALAQKRTPKK